MLAKNLTICASILFAALFCARAAEEDPTAKLREALRNTMIQLRDAQAKTAEMEAASVQSQAEADKLKKDVTKLQSDILEERQASANQQSELRAELAKREEKIAVLEAQVAKWDSDYKVLTAAARKVQQSEYQGKARIAVLERAVAEQQIKNMDMKSVADEILDRYSRHSMGSTVLAREPFISVNRAKLQTIMQDLETRVRAAAIPFGTNAPTAVTARQ